MKRLKATEHVQSHLSSVTDPSGVGGPVQYLQSLDTATQNANSKIPDTPLTLSVLHYLCQYCNVPQSPAAMHRKGTISSSKTQKLLCMEC